MLPALGLLTSPLGKWVYGAAGVALVGVAGFGMGYVRGGVACERGHQTALVAQLQRQQAIHEAARQRGDELATRLAQTQQQLAATKTEYLTYAHAITGHCPADLGVLVGAASGGSALPKAPVKPADAPAAAQAPGIAANLIAANVTENYGRFAACYAQLNALIDWHEKALAK